MVKATPRITYQGKLDFPPFPLEHAGERADQTNKPYNTQGGVHNNSTAGPRQRLRVTVLKNPLVPGPANCGLIRFYAGNNTRQSDRTVTTAVGRNRSVAGDTVLLELKKLQIEEKPAPHVFECC